MIKKLLLYCTKEKPYLNDWKLANPNKRYFISNTRLWSIDLPTQQTYSNLNGKVVAECDFEVGNITYKDNCYHFEFKNAYENVKRTCLSFTELDNYLNHNNGYAIHIKNLHIFDKPKELSDYYSIHNVGGMLLTDKLEKAPRNMQRVSIQEWEYGTYNANDICVLISIRPKGLCKIFNGEKTIELRKTVLKRMIENE